MTPNAPPTEDAEVDIEDYLSGRRLYGDDLSFDEIRRWHADEVDAYADLGAGEVENYDYAYHALNRRYGFRHLGSRRFGRALGLGSAWGFEFEPILTRIDELTILDPCARFTRRSLHGVPVQCRAPHPIGSLDEPDGYFDLITSFGVLHHIPNVRFVLRELSRCLAPDGVLLVREPIVSMGDWRRPRRGLTPRERGIPLALFRAAIAAAGLRIVRERLCMFPLVPRLANRFGVAAYNQPLLTALDAVLCRLFRWNLRYHARRAWQKLRPTNAFFVLQK